MGRVETQACDGSRPGGPPLMLDPSFGYVVLSELNV